MFFSKHRKLRLAIAGGSDFNRSVSVPADRLISKSKNNHTPTTPETE